MIPRRLPLILGLLVAGVMVVDLVFFTWGALATSPSSTPLVVTGVTQWAALSRQVAGGDLRVSSLLSDPNADPHEHEATMLDAARVAQASVVILNGAGYDTWLSQLVTNTSTRITTIDVADLVHVRTGSNPHLFYNPLAAIAFVRALRSSLDSRYGFSDVDARAAKLLANLEATQARVDAIRHACAGVAVTATEDVATYLLRDAGLRVVTPEALRLAVGNGVDPTVGDLALSLAQLKDHPAFLIDNVQTQTPLTTELVVEAQRFHVPVIRVTETMRGNDYVRWIDAEIGQLQSALAREGCWK